MVSTNVFDNSVEDKWIGVESIHELVGEVLVRRLKETDELFGKRVHLR